jgi:hypothetical protein
MRIAILLAYLARSVDKHIFHPTYLFGEGSEAREVLLRQAISNSEQESFIRAVLSSILPKEQDELAELRTGYVIDDVMWIMEDLLPADKAEAFETHLERFVLHAHRVGEVIRTERKRVEPNFDPVSSKDFEWRSFQFDSQASDKAGQKPSVQSVRDDELLVVFPRLYVVENNQDPRPLNTGTVLRNSQALAATEEIVEHPLSPTMGRPTSTRSRVRQGRQSSGST